MELNKLTVLELGIAKLYDSHDQCSTMQCLKYPLFYEGQGLHWNTIEWSINVDRHEKWSVHFLNQDTFDKVTQDYVCTHLSCIRPRLIDYQ